MNRKDFLKASALLSSIMFIPAGKSFKLLAEGEFVFKELRDGAGFYFNRGGTIGWLDTGDALVVVDSQFPDTAKTFKQQLETRNTRKINVLFNTHHHADHTSGNVYLKQFVKSIVANDNCVRLQKEKLGGKDKEIVTANITFSDNWKFDLGKESLYAYHLNPAHTGGDSVIHFENSNIVHTGDLVFNGVYPYVDKADEASLSGWITYLENVHSKFDSDTKFIFGHSYSPEKVTGTKDDLISMKNYLEGLLEFTQKQLKSGKTKEEIFKTEAIPGFENRKALWQGALARNLEAAIIEIKES